MNLKSQAASIASEIEQRAESLPARLGDVRENLASWGTDVAKYARKNPLVAVVAAFALGYGLARVARHA